MCKLPNTNTINCSLTINYWQTLQLTFLFLFFSLHHHNVIICLQSYYYKLFNNTWKMWFNLILIVLFQPVFKKFEQCKQFWCKYYMEYVIWCILWLGWGFNQNMQNCSNLCKNCTTQVGKFFKKCWATTL